MPLLTPLFQPLFHTGLGGLLKLKMINIITDGVMVGKVGLWERPQ